METLQIEQVGELEQYGPVLSLETRFGIVGVVEDNENVAAGSIPVVDQEVRADKLLVVVPLREEFREKVGREGIEKAAAQGMDAQVPLRESKPVAPIGDLERCSACRAKRALRTQRVAPAGVVGSRFET